MDSLKGKKGVGGPDEAAEAVTGGRPARDEVLERVLASRERHRQRSVFVRAGVVVAGGAVGLFAALLSVVVPEVGLPLLLFGLRLLALEFNWAARLYARVARLAKRVAGMFGRLWSRYKVQIILGVALLVAVAVFALLG